ncbi:c-type cytochrome [Mucilaginibacter pallidiroseus]|uniref:C-type cytochrome n=1 Tax=Mucilaginibacter pallidiroseus TaxID=2599295 RepID=A0A563U5C8_9SPHI|nr:cytochrome c3 family protein [Mucilaginibacter pallidiroseus]TWR26547.1 c-type cytochrome [Mucilaginibacter pallidiroseus]
MRNISLILKRFTRSVLLVAGLASLGINAHAEGDPAKGEAIFKAKCTACHKIDTRMVGPALGPQITEETDDAYLTKWIQNNQALIAAKNPKALKIYNEYNQAGMTVFAELSDADVANVITYARTEWKKLQEEKTKGGGANGGGAAAEDKGPSSLVIWGLLGVIVIAFIVILVLNKVIATLERLLLRSKGLLVDEEEETADEKASVDRLATVKKLAKNKKLVFFVVLCGTIAMGSWSWVTMWNTNVHSGYQPVQPIKYSHKLHAGVMKLECQYCHSGAFKSKNASIPSLNVCMNCHKAVKTESPEIQKIYNALGYDPQTQKYDSTKAKPMQWVRVHNLPDLAYFNHSQHVTVAKLECQKCHGQVQEMQEVYQYSPLTMKWCIQCHRRTEVNAKGNAYYDQVLAAHDKIKKGEKVTAAVLGGIECAKCHY